MIKISMLVTKAVSTVVLVTLALQVTSTKAAPIGFATEVLADGPIGYWRLAEAPWNRNRGRLVGTRKQRNLLRGRNHAWAARLSRR